LAAFVAQVLHPVVAGLPGGDESRGAEQAPGKAKRDGAASKGDPGSFVVVRAGNAGRKKAEKVFVDEIVSRRIRDVAEGEGDCRWRVP